MQSNVRSSRRKKTSYALPDLSSVSSTWNSVSWLSLYRSGTASTILVNSSTVSCCLAASSDRKPSTTRQTTSGRGFCASAHAALTISHSRSGVMIARSRASNRCSSRLGERRSKQRISYSSSDGVATYH